METAHRVRHWLAEVDNLALLASAAEEGAQAACLRTLGTLLRLRPEGIESPGLCMVREQEMLRSVEQGAFESAALRMLPGEAKVMTSSPGQGRHLATVKLRGQSHESTSLGSTFALALVSAIAQSIVDRYHEGPAAPAP